MATAGASDASDVSDPTLTAAAAVARLGCFDAPPPRLDLCRVDLGGLATTAGLTAPTRLSRAALAASCSASCLVAPCPVPSGSAPANTTDVYSRLPPTLAPSLS